MKVENSIYVYIETTSSSVIQAISVGENGLRTEVIFLVRGQRIMQFAACVCLFLSIYVALDFKDVSGCKCTKTVNIFPEKRFILPRNCFLKKQVVQLREVTLLKCHFK